MFCKNNNNNTIQRIMKIHSKTNHKPHSRNRSHSWTLFDVASWTLCLLITIPATTSFPNSEFVNAPHENEIDSEDVSSFNSIPLKHEPNQNNKDNNDEENKDSFYEDVFPSGFKWGLGSSAFQIEGAWDADGKGESIWDRFSHEKPERIAGKSSANISCDSYHNFKEDVQLLKSIGVNSYRLSISWPRILPKGTMQVINQAGLKYYNDTINELISQGINPIVCLFHWDLPQSLQESGGWINEETILSYAEYARLVFGTLGDRVKTWITFNEPYTFCYHGYSSGTFAPGIKDPATGPYDCVHTILKAHATAYQLYQEQFFKKDKGKIGISLDNFWQEPADPTSPNDIKAAEQSYMFRFGWIAYPLFRGDYPKIMKDIIDSKSAAAKRKESRLPKFDHEWSQRVNGSLDFLGINHFTTQLVKFSNTSGESWDADSGTIRFYDPKWPSTGSNWLKMVPEGLRKALKKIKEDFNNPVVIITENGVSDTTTELRDSINDSQRVKYFKLYINEVLKAVKMDGCNIQGYIGWSLLDGFEWTQGYTEKFGVVHVNHSHPNRTRTLKKSANELSEIIHNNGFPSQTIRISSLSLPANDNSSSLYNPKVILLCSSPFVVAFTAYNFYHKIL